ncbi:hypothetical protein RHOFW510R12_01310 [Rhodanobacter sp. FW510-R12]|nr:hypothetical protein RHOFW104R8_13535 [Rhodanobacter sp. FW104-R8]
MGQLKDMASTLRAGTALLSQVDDAADMLDAYAERIKAAESTVPLAWCSLTPNGQIAYFDGRPMIMTGRVGNEHHPVPLFAHPPAQAAQVEPDWRIAMFDRWRAAAQEKGYAGIAEAVTAAPTTRTKA